MEDLRTKGNGKLKYNRFRQRGIPHSGPTLHSGVRVTSEVGHSRNNIIQGLVVFNENYKLSNSYLSPCVSEKTQGQTLKDYTF